MRRPKAAKVRAISCRAWSLTGIYDICKCVSWAQQDEIPWECRKRVPDLQYDAELGHLSSKRHCALPRSSDTLLEYMHYPSTALVRSPLPGEHIRQDRTAAALAAPHIEFSRAVHQKRQKEKDDKMVMGQQLP